MASKTNGGNKTSTPGPSRLPGGNFLSKAVSKGRGNGGTPSSTVEKANISMQTKTGPPSSGGPHTKGSGSRVMKPAAVHGTIGRQ